MSDLGSGVMGGTALLRMAGLPVRLWLAGGCPELFALVANTEELAIDYRRRTRWLAEQIGSDLVPHPGLDKQDRRELLKLRRDLHNGQCVSVVQGSAASVLVARVSQLDGPARQLAADVLAAVDCGQRLRAADARLTQELHTEQRRVQGLPWELLQSSRTAWAATATDIPELIGEIERRLANGEGWDGKRLRHRAGYLWRLVARGAVKTTPRSWFGQVALVTVDSCRESHELLMGAASGEQPAAGAHATHQLSNVHRARTGGATADVVSLPGLHWTDGEHLVCWVVDAQDGSRMRQLRVRNTPIVNTIRMALTDGPRHRSELLALLSGTWTYRTDVLAGFVAHLAGLGVLQTDAERTERFSGWQPTSAQHASPAQHTFTDVYRQVSGVVSGTAARRIQRAAETAMRLGALVNTARTARPHPVLELVDEQPRPVTDLIREYLHRHPQWTGTQRTPRPPSRPGWPAPIPGSGYARLLTALQSCKGPAPVVVDDDLLDAVGAPTARLAWPVDGLLRPLPARGGALAVLETVAPAGTLDARFAGALGQLHGESANVGAYRAFLHAVEHELGGQFVELLCPPLSDRAANAVVRPRYTRLSTGDPTHADYYGPGSGGTEYLPLHEITMRRQGSRILAEACGRLLWPICHTTRVALPPWDVVRALLSGAGLPGRNRRTTPGGALAAFPDRDHLPRIVVGDALVVSRAQWRVSRTELWTHGADVRVQARALSRLVQRRGLPRWVVFRARGGRSVPVDLLSLLSIGQLDRMLADAGVDELIAEEMLPFPDQFLLSDTAHAPGDRLAAQLLLRLPVDSTPAEQAQRACATWHSTEPLVAAVG